MSGIGNEKVWYVDMEFPTDKGRVHWQTHVVAPDERTATLEATDWFWRQFDYKGLEPQPIIKAVYEDERGITQHPGKNDDGIDE